MFKVRTWLAGWIFAAGAVAAQAAPPALSDYFPPDEEQGGWRSLLPETGEPDSAGKARIKETTGVDWDKLEDAWKFNTEADGATGLLVIRKGRVVGEWYRGGDRTTAFNIYSSSKAYTSTAFGLILSDFGAGPLPGGRTLTLDTKVCDAQWLPESLPPPDPRKAGITVRHLLNMASGIGGEPVPTGKTDRPFEVALGHTENSPFKSLKGDPGTVFHYSNAGVAHLVLVFNHAQKSDLFPFLKERLLDPIGMKRVRWETIGGGGPDAIGPFAQGYSGIHTNPREHARFCYLALHRGEWAGKRVVPESYYDFAWAGTRVKADYGAQWWTAKGIPGAPADLVATKGKNHNDGFVVPSLDLVFVRLGDGSKFPDGFESKLVRKVVAAVGK